ncbi:ABC transporter ATP-binding protein [Chamaesiphon minutus]|uniref:ABC-type polysaccharide/polyol phosphate transport system, ATPase component n=1 Tax=Chamaesiphon minutus (strain ATCC 27169 / PCC 6605) TaxID=1173020 RepID=K9UAF2_CHAP6|nr:ABC transporter ATP-binding protein [Chamaesiphon minutus]AFY91608.1 ABC-type polysaccharide/polyol phosphate transport system, ATPase component [Chamaesiphon minutus PCC 6605]
MGSEIAISLNNVSKCFKQYRQPVDRLKEMIFPGKSYTEEFWALRDISFEIMRGETMGIIGRNGAGKSTLLQLICGTLTPTYGDIQVNGRVAALLELGAGFNPEFTGRDNVYMNGAIAGLAKAEIDDRFDNIAAFADIKDFIDRPVKNYSSGMYVRLAFAAAIHVEPDILIVDEALAVGDMFFQAKCMTRMRQMMEAGVTVLFVSHDTGSVKSFCQRGVFLEGGELKKIGKAADVVASYISVIHGDMNQDLKLQLQQNLENSEKNLDLQNGKSAKNVIIDADISEIFVDTKQQAELAEGCHRYGEGGAKVLDIKLLNSQHQPTAELESREEFIIQAAILFEKDFPTFCFGYLIRDIKGIDIIGTVTSVEKVDMPPATAGQVYVVEMRSPNMLNVGVYTLTVAVELPVVMNQNHIFLDYIDDAIVFKVNMAEDPLDRFTAKVYVPAEIKCKHVNN